ncbi:MAG: site-2 protease family protein [Burkholderiaceae bacterium]|nr:site-2 protease family protein [Burkholderiaceae bacterium]
MASIIQSLIVFVLAIAVHEAAHGYVARHFGDNTAAAMGRVTLNPLKHIDPVGTVLLPLILYFSTGFAFGYAKPVPVNFGRLRNPKRDMIWVALAGPVSNLIQALLWGIAGVLLLPLYGAGAMVHFFLGMCGIGTMVNLMLFALNLFPLPPLDGGRVLVGLLPRNAAIAVSRIEPWGIWIAAALLVTGVLGNLWMYPLVSAIRTLLIALLPPLKILLPWF